MTHRAQSEFSNAIRGHVEAVLSQMALPRICEVTSYSPEKGVKVSVSIAPDSPIVESGWMPLGAIAVGDEWGIVAGAQIGDQVICVFEGGDRDGGVVIGRLFSTKAKPMPVPSGEFWLVHKSGSSLKFENDGSVQIHAESDLVATVGGNANVTTTGNANITGENVAVTASSGIVGVSGLQGVQLGDMGAALRKIVTEEFVALFNQHTHPCPGGVTSPPNQQMTDLHLTSRAKGN